ncbi:MAG: sigma-70 family RNA polymerase sigma factor [Firmicutes bacterium]|nr:sigma-70 family RNA polymerase sigma factor [Bacillota bacterium]
MSETGWASLPDERLAQEAASGSRDAYAELVRRHSQRLLNLAWRMSGSREAAWDAVQDAFLAGWKHIRSFRQEGGFYSWVRRILVNVVLGEKRKGGGVRMVPLDKPLEFGEGSEPIDVPDPGSDPGEIASRSETIEEIRRAVESLPDIYRTVFLMRETEEMSYSEIAQAMNLNEGTVKSRLNMARRLLRESLRKEVEAARFA